MELAARPVTVYELQVAEYEYPRLALEICCGSGTYVRSLGRNLADTLGTAAVMADLVRTAIGPFRVEDACNPRSLTAEQLPAALIPAIRAVESLGVAALSDEEIARLAGRNAGRRGGRIACRRPAGAELAAVDPAAGWRRSSGFMPTDG